MSSDTTEDLHMSDIFKDRQAQALANMMGADSRRIDELVGDVGEIKGTVAGVKDGVDELRNALAVLVRHDVQMEHNRQAADALRAKVEIIDGRLHAVESALPPLVEMRAWAVRAMLGVLGVIGLALLGLVLVKGTP